jgi:hypothetical protein
MVGPCRVRRQSVVAVTHTSPAWRGGPSAARPGLFPPVVWAPPWTWNSTGARTSAPSRCASTRLAGAHAEAPVADLARRRVPRSHAQLGDHELPAGQRRLGPGREWLADALPTLSGARSPAPKAGSVARLEAYDASTADVRCSTRCSAWSEKPSARRMLSRGRSVCLWTSAPVLRAGFDGLPDVPRGARASSPTIGLGLVAAPDEAARCH